MTIAISALWRAFLNLLYPAICPTCQTRLSDSIGLCGTCTSQIEMYSSGPAACRYEGVLKQAIHLFKYNGMTVLCNTLSGLMLKFVNQHIDMKKIDAIIPVPLYPAKLRERGFNQAYLLSLAISKRYCVPVLKDSLIKRIPTRPQSNLSRDRRLNNLGPDAFAVKRPDAVRGKRILLVDDVYTTGTTVRSSCSALKKAGAKGIKVVALAKGRIDK